MLLIALEYLILASTFTIAKKVLSYSPYLFLLTARVLVGGIFLVASMHVMKKISWQAVWRDRWLFILAGFLHIYIAFLFEFWSLQYLTSAKTALMYAITPFVAAVLSRILYKERLSALKWAGIGIGTLSLLPILSLQVTGFSEFLYFSLPEAVLCTAVVSACAAWFVVKELMARGHHLVTVNGIAMLIGAGFFLPTLLLIEPCAWQQVSSWPAFMGWLALLIFLSQVVSYNLYSWLLTRYSITFMTLCGFLCPLFSAALGAAWLGELIPWQYWISLCGVVCGLVLFTTRVGAKNNH
jgi:drug/metabolite transporter (DMT)-like permease